VTLALLAFLSDRGLAWAEGRSPSPDDPPSGPAPSRLPRPLAAGLIAFGAVAGGIPLLRYLFRVLQGLFDPQLPLTVDVVTYHLPAVIEFFKARSLWSMEGFYQSYSFGYDLIANLPGLFLPSHSGLYAADALSVAFFLAALFALCRESLGPAGFAHLDARPVWAFTAGVSLYFSRPDKLHAGKNDLFLAAVILAAFVFLLRTAAVPAGKEAPARRLLPLFLSALALGLAVGTKPSALPFLPVLCLVLFALLGARETKGERGAFARPALAALGYGAFAFAFGGFFTLRNLLVLGALSSPRIMASGFSMTVAANLANPLFWRPSKGALFLAATLLILLALALAILLRRRQRRTLLPAAYAVLFTAAFIAYCLHPFAVYRVTAAGPATDNRYAVTLIALAALSLPLIGVSLAPPRIGERPMPAPSRPGRLAAGAGPLGALAVPLLLGLVAASSAWYQLHPLRGLPGFTGPGKGAGGGDVYTFVQDLGPSRIFAAGLPPYGLYGKGWKNQVRYEISSRPLYPGGGGFAALATALDTFRPDVLVAAADDFLRPEAAPKPEIAGWLAGRGEGWTEAYSDPRASVFTRRR